MTQKAFAATQFVTVFIRSHKNIVPCLVALLHWLCLLHGISRSGWCPSHPSLAVFDSIRHTFTSYISPSVNKLPWDLGPMLVGTSNRFAGVLSVPLDQSPSSSITDLKCKLQKTSWDHFRCVCESSKMVPLVAFVQHGATQKRRCSTLSSSGRTEKTAKSR